MFYTFTLNVARETQIPFHVVSPSGIHYTQLMLWLIFDGNVSVFFHTLRLRVLVRRKSQMENYYYNDVAIIGDGDKAGAVERQKVEPQSKNYPTE